MRFPLSLDHADRTVDAIALGENSLDLIAVVDGHPQANAKVPLADYRELAGGEAASAAVVLSRLGFHAAYLGSFGDDRLGQLARQQIGDAGVDLSLAQVARDTPNRMAVILVDRRTGDRTVLWKRDPRLHLDPDLVADRVLARSRVLLVGSDDAANMAVVAGRARALGVRTVGDLEHVQPDTPELLRHLDVIVTAEAFPQALTGEPTVGAALRAIARHSRAALVCVTLGADGCLALSDGQEIRSPAFDIEVVDTTGAGDAFRAGLIAGWLLDPEGPDLVYLLRYANAVAALNCRKVGAFTAAPLRSEVEALVRS